MTERNNYGERITRLETQVVSLTEKLDESNKYLKDTKNTLTTIRDDLYSLRTGLERYRGFVGGVILVMSSIISVFVTFKTWILAKFGVPS